MKIKSPAWYARLKHRAGRLKQEIWALFLALKDPETPALARSIIVVAVAYAASPVDLIPDFIPILGQLDDLVIVPALIAWAVRLIRPEVLARCRQEAEKHLAAGERVKTPAVTVAAVLFVLLWVALIAWLVTRFI